VFTQFKTPEWLALAGLIRLVRDADGKITPKEHQKVAALVRHFGPTLWEFLAKAERQLEDEDAVRRQAAKVERPEAREAIREALVEMANTDGMSDAEQRVLDWLDALWAATPA